MVWPFRLGIRHREGYKKLNVAQKRHGFVLYKHGLCNVRWVLHTHRVSQLFCFDNKRLLPHFCRSLHYITARTVKTLKYLLLLLLFTCGEPKIDEEKERELVAYVCYNPDSIWHLSECNDECTRRDYTGNAYCMSLFDTMCKTSNDQFISQACGLYYE